jgi:hypothetical protein
MKLLNWATLAWFVVNAVLFGKALLPRESDVDRVSAFLEQAPVDVCSEIYASLVEFSHDCGL